MVRPEQRECVLVRVRDVVEVDGPFGISGVQLDRDVDAKVEHGVSGSINQAIELGFGGGNVWKV